MGDRPSLRSALAATEVPAPTPPAAPVPLRMRTSPAVDAADEVVEAPRAPAKKGMSILDLVAEESEAPGAEAEPALKPKRKRARPSRAQPVQAVDAEPDVESEPEPEVVSEPEPTSLRPSLRQSPSLGPRGRGGARARIAPTARSSETPHGIHVDHRREEDARGGRRPRRRRAGRTTSRERVSTASGASTCSPCWRCSSGGLGVAARGPLRSRGAGSGAGDGRGRRWSRPGSRSCSGTCGSGSSSCSGSPISPRMAETPARWREPRARLALRWGSWTGRSWGGLTLVIGGGTAIAGTTVETASAGSRRSGSSPTSSGGP